MPGQKKEFTLTGVVNRFISYYCDFEDLKRAAIHCGITEEKAQWYYRKKPVRAEIDRRLDKIHNEQAKLIARSRNVDIRFLDDRLVEAVKKGAARGDVKALELGYRRVGIFREGEFMGAPQEPSKTTEQSPMIFRVERTVTRTEQITDRAESSGPLAPIPSAPEILQY